jgi:hypothetical protein
MDTYMEMIPYFIRLNVLADNFFFVLYGIKFHPFDRLTSSKFELYRTG